MRFLLIILLTFFSYASLAQDEEDLGCSDVYSYLIFDAANNNIIDETRSEQIAYPASLVKLMTLYLTFEALQKKQIRMNQVLEFSARGEEISDINKVTTLHIKEGDKITVKQAIQGTIVKSFNETAVILAEAVAGSEWEFVHQMNDKAFELGMLNTSFRNASGLHEVGQYTTSYDLARLVIALRRDFPGYYPLFSLKEFEFNGKKFETHNHVLMDYAGAEGLKTGFTSASGFNLISAATKAKQRLISIMLGCKSFESRDIFTKELFDRNFEDLKAGHLPKSPILNKFNYSKKPPMDKEDFNRIGGAFPEE